MLEEVEQELVGYYANGQRQPIVDNILAGTSYYRKSSFDLALSDLSFYYCVLDNDTTGFAYFNKSPLSEEQLIKLINKPVLGAAEDTTDIALRVALLDAAYGKYKHKSRIRRVKTYTITGGYKKKADFRSQLLTHDLHGKRVVVVGLVSEFVRDLLANDCKVSVIDLSPELRNKKILDIPIITEGNDTTLELIKSADYALISGCTVANGTIDSIISVAKKSKTCVRFYMETGGNLAPKVKEAGAELVVAEIFPFYDMPGTTRFEVY